MISFKLLLSTFYAIFYATLFAKTNMPNLGHLINFCLKQWIKQRSKVCYIMRSVSILYLYQCLKMMTILFLSQLQTKSAFQHKPVVGGARTK